MDTRERTLTVNTPAGPVEVTEDRSDIARAVVRHVPDGSVYIVEYCGIWTAGDQPEAIGTQIIAAAGPIVERDLFGDDYNFGMSGPPPDDVWQKIRDWQDLTDENADWLQAEEDASWLEYPLGGRA